MLANTQWNVLERLKGHHHPSSSPNGNQLIRSIIIKDRP